MNCDLTIDNLCYAYHSLSGEIPALENISFTVKNGEFVSIVGPSGCGKSTLLSIIFGLLSPESGSLSINNLPISKSNVKIGYMLQKDHLFEWRTIYENVILGLEIQHTLNSESKQKALDMLKTYDLYKFKDSRPSELSGGMRQRAALIRTLILEPDLLLLDEPFSALDYQTRLNVSDDIGSIIKHEKKTAILVTHDLSEAISMSDKVVVFSNRPATVKKIIPIIYSTDNITPFASRNTPEFKTYFNEIWKELN